MADIFNYSAVVAKPRGVFEASKSILTFNNPTEGMLVQNWTLNYTQDIAEIFELGSDAVYWVRGRPVGDGSIQRIMGTGGESGPYGLLPEDAFNVCKGGAQMQLRAGSGLCPGVSGEELNITVDGLIITSIGYTMNAPSSGGSTGILNEDIKFKFSYMAVN